jgi:ABC-type lipoprotein release transport system permease subunit
MNTFKMAMRNVGRNRRRTAVTVAAMSLALAVMILYSGLVTGFIRANERNLLDLELGEVQVYAEGYKDNPSIYKRIVETEDLIARLEAQGFKASARLLAAGLAAAGDTSAGVSFIGVDVDRDATVSRIFENVSRGEWLDPAAPGEVVIGRKLARNLNVDLGAELVVLSQGADGSMANEIYKVRGILKGITDSVDRSGFFMTEEAFRELMVFTEGTHQVIVRKPDNLDLNASLLRVRELAPGEDVRSWRQLFPTLASVMDSSQGMMYVMFVIVYIAIGILILNAMLMAVFERIREFGVLKAIGVGPGGVVWLIFIESMIQTGLAVVAGVAVAIPGSMYLSRVGIDLTSLGGFSIHGIAWDPIWRAEMDANTWVGPIVTMTIIVVIAVIYPAIKAALIQPVRAIQHH